MKEEVSANDSPKAPGLLSQAIISNNFVFTSGQIHNLSDGTLIDGSIKEKTNQVMKNLAAILEAAGTNLNSVVKATLYVTDISFAPEVNEVYKTYFTEEPLPAREMVCVQALPMGANIEISVVATTS